MAFFKFTSNSIRRLSPMEVVWRRKTTLPFKNKKIGRTL
nr:MAG TPA: hypothetical protein [Bacteriophage sp.]